MTPMDTIGFWTGLKDCKGNPICIGDKLRFDAEEWGDNETNEFVVRFERGELTICGSIGDLGQYCEIIERGVA